VSPSRARCALTVSVLNNDSCRIFGAACDLFYQHGIRDVGVDQIATEAGTNKMSFYRSFHSKDEARRRILKQKQSEFS
jgi:AcrR family transcriptional regulator